MLNAPIEKGKVSNHWVEADLENPNHQKIVKDLDFMAKRKARWRLKKC